MECPATQYRKEHNISSNEQIRNYFSEDQLDDVERLERYDVQLIISQEIYSYEERKQILQTEYDRVKTEKLSGYKKGGVFYIENNKSPTATLELPDTVNRFVKIPKEVILANTLPEHRLSALLYLNYNQTWENVVHYSPIYMIQWCKYKPNWHRGTEKNIFTSLEIAWIGSLKIDTSLTLIKRNIYRIPFSHH